MLNLNFIVDNPIVFYGLFAAVSCHIGFSFLNSILHSPKKPSDTNDQTFVCEDGLSQTTQNSSTTTNTHTPEISLNQINEGSQGDPSTPDEVIKVVVDNIDPNTIINLDGHPDVMVTGISTVNDSTIIEGFVRGTDELVKLAQLFGS